MAITVFVRRQSHGLFSRPNSRRAGKPGAMDPAEIERLIADGVLFATGD
jgi:hypothetical protein